MNRPLKRQPDLTRQTLLAAAFEEIHRSGFRAASLDAILETTGVTKGALYHHFGSKAELGYAVVEEVIKPFVEAGWKPLLQAEDCVSVALSLCKQLAQQRSERAIECGCPFNNLINEMSPVDEGFRVRLQQILDDWRAGLIQALKAGQLRDVVRKNVEPAAAAAFIIGSIEGCVGMAKAKQSREFMDAGMRGLMDYLEQLRVRPPAITSQVI